MSDCTCPRCGHRFALETPAVSAAELEQACRERGLMVTPDGRVREDVAAAFLQRSVGTLENWAYGDRRLPFVRAGRRRTYRLSDIAEFMHQEK